MSFKKWLLTFVLILSASTLSNLFAAQNGFSIYLAAKKKISSNQLIEKGIQYVWLEKKPLITTDDIVSYNKKTHEIVLTPKAFDRYLKIKDLGISAPFVVCVGKERIYAGDFVLPICSASFNGVVIEECQSMGICDQQFKNKVLRLQLGYPGENFFKGFDPRSDSRILDALKQARKLTNGTN